ncbi:division abnormally delayed protein isoform X2 [Leptinotarsa decemlineata]|uniref:division abnormally delayed protein isoform X2 n=1 Tax=Leptinotarsa decemlineata TaxID=7539 RepID=UPI003D307F3C
MKSNIILQLFLVHFVKKIFAESESDYPGSICGGQCCDEKTEVLLRKQGQRDFADLLRHNSRSLQGLLISTATTLQNHVSELARQSENKTLLLFWHVYQGMAVLSRKPIENLYREIMNYVVIDSTEAKPAVSPEEIVASVTSFFTELFPLAYHHSADISNKDFTLNYKACLKKSIDFISPFGDIPKQLAQSLSKSLEATQLLLQAFRIGTEVLNTTDTLLIDEHSAGNSECHTALLKMTYCPKCMGLRKNTKPCSGYCLNVLRGCITKYVAELDLPWNGYVEGIESLLNAMKKSNNDAGINADAVIRNLDTKISDAIMHYMANTKDIDDRVKKTCGAAEFSQKEDPLIAETSTPTLISSSGKPRSTNPRNFSPLPENELSHFLSAIGKTKGFYANLANTLCQDESFAERKDKQCWNGERIAEYTKTVVDVGLDMQKYNPEVKPNTNIQSVDPKVANLVDKLQRVHHMAISSLGSNYSDADYMQGDGAEGSGSGSGPDIEEDDQDDDHIGSGSGSGPRHDDDIGKTDDSSPRDSSGGTKTTNVQTPTVTIVGSGCCSPVTHYTMIPMLLVCMVFHWRIY